MRQVEDIKKYIGIAVKRKYWVIIPLLLTILGGLTYAVTAQRIFRGETLILVIPQKVPEGYVQSIVHMSMEERLRTIKQQVTSRTNLERIMTENSLFNEPERNRLLDEEKIEVFRKRIGINVARGTAFSITFDYEDPKKAMDVTNKLASNFISENLKIREEQALGTSHFLQDELELIRKRLEEKEALIQKYREQYMGAMPQDLTTNLSSLQRLQNRMDQLNTNLRAAEERRLIVQQQMATQKMMQDQMASTLLSDSSSADETGEAFGYTESPELASLRNELSKLERKYTENHPEVRRLRSMIAKVESQKNDDVALTAVEEKQTGPIETFSLTDLLKPQLEQVNSEIASLRTEIQKVKVQLEIHERRVDETPKREQEMISLTRDYDNLKGQYDTLVKRKLEADIAVNMEKKQKGEQFKLLDPAKLPERPVKPNVLRILMFSCVFGLCLGGGITFAKETLDTSYKSPEEVEVELQLPVIASLAYRYTEKELRKQKLKGILKGATVAAGFMISALCILVATKGVEKTLEFMKNLFLGQT